jgi:signal transduction histidine kinase
MGLVQATLEYCQDFSETYGIETTFDSGGIDLLSLDPDTEINLYRLVQEGLTNVRKHADASHVAVKLVAAYPNVILRLQDDGKGFDVNERLTNRTGEKRIGLTSMEERVRHLRGEMKIQSKPLQGTRITVRIPYQENKHGSQEINSTC